MRLFTRLLPVLAVLCLVGAALADGMRTRPPVVKPDRAVISPGFSREFVEVKFLDGVDITLDNKGYPQDRADIALRSAKAVEVLQTIQAAGGVWQRSQSLPEDRVDELRERAEERLNQAIADLNNYFMLRVPSGATTEIWIDALNSLNASFTTR